MSKSRIQYAEYLSKNNLALFTILAMLIGFLCSRSIASIAMFLFAVNALRNIPPRKWLLARWYLLGLLWVGIFAASWFWSDNKGEWAALFQVKLPFLFFPLAFSFLDPWDARQLRAYTVMLWGTMVAGACYSISFFLRDPAALIQGYSFSHILPTPAYQDHISFSTAVAATIAWSFYAWPLWQSRPAKMLISICTIFLILYLHLLAAKTGLLALYVFLACYLVYYTITKSWKRGVLYFLGVLAGIYLAYATIPTFRTRVIYVIYTHQLYREGTRTGAYSDMGRVISYDIASKIIAKTPVLGVGGGDMLDEMGKGYKAWYPQIGESEWLIPHNQFITVALGLGIPAALIFVWWCLAPLSLVRRNRNGFFFFTTWLLLLVPLFTDAFLEVQFGVFVYLFFLLMQRSVLVENPTHPSEQMALPS